MKKLILILMLIGVAGAFFVGNEGEKPSEPIAKTPEQLQQEAEKIKVNSARVTCRSLVGQAAKYKDTVEYKSIQTFDTPQGGVLVKLDWTAENKLGAPVRYGSSCNVLDNEVILFTVDDNVLIEKQVNQS